MAVADLSAFAQALNIRESARLCFEPARGGVISWNTYAAAGKLSFRLLRANSPASTWYDYAEWHPSGRKSFSAQSDRDGVRVDVDLLHAEQPFDGIELFADGVDFNMLAFASPVRTVPSLPYARDAMVLDVPARSQYVADDQSGWCSPATLSMVNRYHGIDVGVEETARGVMDRAYNGTGNWAFNVAYSGSLGLRAVVAFLRNLDHAQRLIERNLPVILSYSWAEGELPGAPLERSDGHLAVLCGFTSDGSCAINDPAARDVRVVYPRTAIEALWQRNDCIAYVIAPVGIDYASVLADNA
ncbi:MAG: C39 family peptidase [Candidatus Eremiobacteraeota bacterium]|nr:C39 family peptidase [Candidatus Eremiobacteraeota bacterium]